MDGNVEVRTELRKALFEQVLIYLYRRWQFCPLIHESAYPLETTKRPGGEKTEKRHICIATNTPCALTASRWRREQRGLH